MKFKVGDIVYAKPTKIHSGDGCHSRNYHLYFPSGIGIIIKVSINVYRVKLICRTRNIKGSEINWNYYKDEVDEVNNEELTQKEEDMIMVHKI